MKLSIVLILVGLVMIAFGILLLYLGITDWDVWIAHLKPIGMTIIVIISVLLIVIGSFLIIKFIT